MLEQNIICEKIISVKSDDWVKDLRDNNIVLSDIDSDSQRIEIVSLSIRIV